MKEKKKLLSIVIFILLLGTITYLIFSIFLINIKITDLNNKLVNETDKQAILSNKTRRIWDSIVNHSNKIEDITIKVFDSMTVSIIVPKDLDAYHKLDWDCYFETLDSLYSIDFIKKDIITKRQEDKIKASADAAAKFIHPLGGPEYASIIYFKVYDNTAYCLLDIYIDGYMRVSYDLRKIEPLIEKTLLQFVEIENVVFSVCPEDDYMDIYDRYMELHYD